MSVKSPIFILGKSNAAVAMIVEILFNNNTNNNIDLQINIIKNMSDNSNLDYKIYKLNMIEYFDNDTENNNILFNNKNKYVIGAYRTEGKLKIYNYFLKNHNIDVSINNFVNLVSLNSYIASTVKIGKGCLVSHNCVIDSFSILHNFVTLNRSSSIGHHTTIGEFTTINPNTHIAGNCIIGKNVQIGMSATIIDGITVGNNVIIGANSFINKNVPDNVLIYGSPAKIIKYFN